MGLGLFNNYNYAYRSARGRYTSAVTSYFGVRMYVPTIGVNYYFGTLDTQTIGNQIQWTLQFDSYGNITFSTNGSIVGKTTAFSFNPGRWFYLEIKWTPGVTGGIEVRVNTVVVLSLPTARTSVGTLISPATLPGFDMLFFQNQPSDLNTSTSWRWDDMYFLDSAGTVNNTYLGNVRAKYLAPIANSTPLQWVIGGSSPAATNWQSVLNTTLDDTKFVYSSTAGNRDLYTLDPNLNTPGVYGVELSGAFRQDDATQRVVTNTLRSGATDAFGVDHYTNQTFTFYPDLFEVNPATGVAFTGAEVNALKVGPKVIT